MNQNYIIPLWDIPALKVSKTEALFPVHRIFCVGQNYTAHVKEMHGNTERKQPFFFAKPPSSLRSNGTQIPYPSETQELHHEVELVAAIDKEGSNIFVEHALEHVFGYAAGIDLTRRDLQRVAKERRQPWETSKAFEASAPCGMLLPASETGDMSQKAISLSVNGVLRQQGNINEMIWSVPEIVSALSRYFRLMPGDLIFTGTPAGVSELNSGDTVTGSIEGLSDISVSIA